MDNHYYYEVVRIKNGCMLHINQHIERLIESVFIGTGKKLELHQVKQSVDDFLKKNGVRNQNFKITIDAMSYKINIIYIDSVYPSEGDYQQGVMAKSFKFSRHNPHIKQRSDALFDIRKRIADENIHDFLLVNTSGIITEGTKTNVFFIQNGSLIVPNRQHALLGITMQNVLNAAQKVMPIVERDIALTDLKHVEAAFFSGTSIGMLPISKIDDWIFGSAQNVYFLKLKEQYYNDESEYCKLESGRYADKN